MIGDAETFLNTRKGKEILIQFFDLLRQRGNIYDGFPVKCERHPDRTSILRRAEDFEEESRWGMQGAMVSNTKRTAFSTLTIDFSKTHFPY